MTDSDYADDLALHIITPLQAVSSLHRLEKSSEGIGLYVNANKTVFLCFKLERGISIQSGNLLKLVD